MTEFSSGIEALEAVKHPEIIRIVSHVDERGPVVSSSGLILKKPQEGHLYE